MNLTVFGIGYVGLVQAAVLAEVGHQVVCVDIDADKVERLNQGVVPIFEPGLENLVKENHAAGRIKFTTDAAAAVRHGEIQMIAVGTPPGEDGSADLKYVLAVAETIGREMDKPKIVVGKSTVPVGTCEKVKARIADTLKKRGREDLAFDVASNPEFLKEGSAVADCMKPDRIIVGTDSEDTEAVMRELYAPFNRNHEKMIVMDVRSAEFTKYAANCMLATKISFMNEIANIAEKVGADIEMVRQGIGSDPRIGWHFIYPGAGYGGSCFPKDVQALAHTSQQHGHPPTLLAAVEAVNEHQKGHLFELMQRHYGSVGALRGKTVALWGLAFKPNTDDMRAASSRKLLQQLWDAGAKVRAYDPEAMDETRRIFGEHDGLVLCGSAGAALQGADALVVITEWKQFRSPDFTHLRTRLADAVVFDGRNLYEPHEVEDAGLAYYGIGRGRSILID
jgi:UDPglucose 6-dehydrogenase